MRKKGLIFAIGVLVVSVLFFGCGGDGGSTTTEQPSPNILQITGIPEDAAYDFLNSAGWVGIFPSDTSFGDALAIFNTAMTPGAFPASLVAGSTIDDARFGHPPPSLTGEDTIIANFPLYTNWQGSPWAGSGTYRIGIIFQAAPTPRYFSEPIFFTTGTTIVEFDPDWAQ